jgi:hypothetical protein
MGRKGVSKRKPKQQKSSSNTNASASTRSGGNAVAALVKDTGAPLNRGGPKPSSGSNKNRNKGN